MLAGNMSSPCPAAQLNRPRKWHSRAGARPKLQHGTCQQWTCRAATAAPGPCKAAEPDLRTASLLLLVAESFKRATGRPLVAPADLLQVPTLLSELKCALLIAEPDQAPAASSGRMSGEAPSSSSPHHVITYLNTAAQQLLQGPAAGNHLQDTAAGPPRLTLDQVLTQPLPDVAMQYQALAPGQAPGWRWVRGCGFHAQAPDAQALSPHAPHVDAQAVADCVVCDVASPTGRVLGKAVLWDRWEFTADGRVGRPGVPALHPTQVPSEGDVESALGEVRCQADAVKALKAQAGQNNQDAAVKQAVVRLQSLKQQAAHLQQLRDAYVVPQHTASEGQLVSSPYTVLLGLVEQGVQQHQQHQHWPRNDSVLWQVD